MITLSHVFIMMMVIVIGIMLITHQEEAMPKIEDVLMKKVTAPLEDSDNKISVIGMGQVGIAVAISLLTQYVTDEIALVDRNESKVVGEAMDLQHGSYFMKSPTIKASTDYAITTHSKICIVTAGAAQKEGQTRIDLIATNLKIIQKIIPKVVKHNPNTILLIVSNPVDILTYAAWKLSGFPKHRVIGSGTNLDSSRLRFLISQRFHVSVESVEGWIIGEHGDSSVPVWSGVTVAGVRLLDLNKNLGQDNDPDKFKDIHTKVVNSAYEVIRLKSYTSWGVGLSVADICQTILRNDDSVHAVSTAVQGIHGIDENVFISLPCILGGNGVSNIIIQPLTETEKLGLKKSAESLYSVIRQLDIDTIGIRNDA